MMHFLFFFLFFLLWRQNDLSSIKFSLFLPSSSSLSPLHSASLLNWTQLIPSLSCLYCVIKGHCTVPWTAWEAVGCVERQLLSAQSQTSWGFVLLSWKAWNKRLVFSSTSSDIDLFTFWKRTRCLAYAPGSWMSLDVLKKRLRPCYCTCVLEAQVCECQGHQAHKVKARNISMEYGM